VQSFWSLTHAAVFAVLLATGSGSVHAANQVPAFKPDAVVAADGSGTFTTVQAAINAAPQTTSAAKRWVIFIKAGIYRELVQVQREKRFVSLVGEDPARTVITYALNATMPGADGLPMGTFRTPTVWIDADDFAAENLTFENSAGPVGQALAVRVDGDRVVFRNCRFVGWQDTVLLNRGRHYLAESFIAGHVDFIFGGATAYFDHCDVHVWGNGYVTAASTPTDQPFGFVFADGSITGEPDARTYLGRPWRDFAQVAFLRTTMSDVVRPEGWHNWDKPERERTARYAEWDSRGPGGAGKGRVAWAQHWTQADANDATIDRVLGGADHWDPRAVPAHPSAGQARALPRPAAPGRVAAAGSAQLAPATAAPVAVAWDAVLRQPDAWYKTAAATEIAANVVRYQRASGGWPKNIDMAKALSTAERAALADERALNDTTIDNGATVTQIRFLAKVLAATSDSQWRAPIAAGLDWLLAAQYPNGGWPQYFPLRTDYSRHITFNDDAMVNVLLVLDDVAEGRAPLDVAPPPVRTRAKAAVARGIDVLLRTQISVDGKLTGWCQQHDEVTLKPAPARAYEHVSTSGKETVGIVRFLMRADRPDARVVAAIEGAVSWLTAVQIKGTRIDRQPAVGAVNGMDNVLVPDPSAPPLWARFYEIGTNKPIFSGRDGVIRYNLSEIELERRSGYSWIGPYASALLQTEYPAWRKRVGRSS